MFLVKPSDDSGFLNTNSMSAVGDFQCKSLMSNNGFSRTNKRHIQGLIKKYPTKDQKKQTNPWCCSHNPLQSSLLQALHTCSSSPFIVQSTFGTDSLEQPTAASRFSFYLLHVLKPIPLQQHFHLREQTTVTWGHVQWIGMTQHLWDLMFSQEFYTRWDKRVGTLSWCSCK
jgi:hypothetical protein